MSVELVAKEGDRHLVSLPDPVACVAPVFKRCARVCVCS